MFTVNVNGKDYNCEQDKKLLNFLRDELHLTAAKDGCSEGACGTCTVLVDGKKQKACVVPLSKLAGKKIVTVEGIAPEEMEIHEHCFAEAGSLAALEGREFYADYYAETDALSLNLKNPRHHVSYSYGAQLMILNEEGRITKAISAFDVGTPVSIQTIEGQIEGGTIMGIGYGLTEKFECVDGYPKSKFGTVGFMRADQIPELEVILCPSAQEDRLPCSLGAKGCGELCMVPTAPACAHAYYRLDGKFRQSLPLEDTPYRKARKG